MERETVLAPPAEVEAASDFATVFRAHRTDALRLAYVLTGDAATCEDIVADAFAGMYARWKRGRVDDPRAYLRRAIVNQVRGRFRRAATRHRHDSRARAHEPSTQSDDQGVVERDRLHRALLELPPRQRATVVLRVIEDLSEIDTARELGISTGTVKANLSRGLDRLRAALEEGER